MKVLNLICEQRHPFEGWFASENEFQTQLATGLVECPLCGDKRVVKLPSAPRLNLSGALRVKPSGAGERATEAGSTPSQASLPEAQLRDSMPDAMQRAVFEAMRRMVTDSVDVGERFAEEARRMHYGETRTQSIRGKATQAERDSLAEEGIDCLVLPAIPAFESPLQ
jgi:hypothetical protein